MPKFLESRLRAEAAAKGFSGKHADQYVFGAMNNMGAMKGNTETVKGKRMDAKHAAKVGQHPHRNLGAYLHKAKSR